jgi:hypothetical protein
VQGSLVDFLVDSCSSDDEVCSSESVSDASDDACEGTGLLPSRRRQQMKREEGGGDGGQAGSGRRRQRRPSMKSVYLTSLLPMSQMPEGFGFRAPKFNVRGFKLRKQEVEEEEEEEEDESLLIAARDGGGNDDEEEEDDEGNVDVAGGDHDHIAAGCASYGAKGFASSAGGGGDGMVRRSDSARSDGWAQKDVGAAGTPWQQQQQQQQPFEARDAVGFRSLRMQRRRH